MNNLVRGEGDKKRGRGWRERERGRDGGRWWELRDGERG
jgi:hypothetical protein